MTIKNTGVDVPEERRVLYRKVHKYGKSEHLIEVSKTKFKYYIIAIKLNKHQATQVLEVSL